MFNPARLRILYELHRLGSISRTATALGRTPSAISQQLSALEEDAGVSLVERFGRGIRLTDAGEILAKYAADMVVLLQEAESAIAQHRLEVTGKLDFAVFQTAALSFVPEVISRVRQEYPGLDLKLTEIDPDTAVERLLAQHFDVILGEEYPGCPIKPQWQVHRFNLGTDRMTLYLPCSGPLSSPVSLTECHEIPFVMEPRGNAARRWAEQLCWDAGFTPQVVYETTDLHIHARLVETKHAAAFLPNLFFAGFPQYRLGARPLPDSQVRTLFAATHRGMATRPAVVGLVRILTEVIAQVHAVPACDGSDTCPGRTHSTDQENAPDQAGANPTNGLPAAH